MTDDPVSIVIADDEWNWLESVVAVLHREDGLDIRGKASSAETCLEIVVREQPQVALIDLRMPEMGGAELTRRIKSESPGTAVLILTIERDHDQLIELISAGASGYLLKGDMTDPARLYEAVRIAARGGALLSTEDGASTLRDLAQREAADPAARFGLTPREREVLALLAQGYSNRDVGERLSIEEQSVKNHVSNLLRKLGARSRTEAAMMAVQLGMISPGQT